MQLFLLLSLFLSSFALGSPSDVLYIQKLDADDAQKLDNKDFAGLEHIFTKTATYIDTGADPQQTYYGIGNIRAFLAEVFPPERITQNVISTESITLLPPFDEQGAASTATGVVYLTSTSIGQGDSEGQGLVVFAKYKNNYIKTEDFASYGGWRIGEQFFIPV
ncbi:hypothetical protein MMC29_001901, partial [Sticta canariensis]|nr:hypothetical protein [Sticta canariensis]